MVVHLSPKAKALTLPLNWSQFLKTLIGAENYTLFQLPPNKTGVRLSAVILYSISVYFVASRLLLLRSISATRIFLFTSWAIVRNIEIARRISLERVEFLLRDTPREIGRPIMRWSVGRLRNEVSVSEHLTSIRLLTLTVVIHKTSWLRKKSPASTTTLSQTEFRGYPFNKLVVACRVKRATGDVP